MRKKGCGAVGCLTIILLIVVAVLTNPHRSKHLARASAVLKREAVARGVKEAIYGPAIPAEPALAKLGVEYSSYYLLSVLRVRGTVLTVGVLGYVWLND
jgi:hypothetical protein